MVRCFDSCENNEFAKNPKIYLRACPPEDVGGIGGYETFLEIIKNPDHEEYEETLEWAGREFDPEQFDCEEVSFNDPAKRLKMGY